MDSHWYNVAKGCALRCAALSRIYRVQEFEITERFPFTISLSGMSGSAGVTEQGKSRQIVIPRASDMPCLMTVTCPHSGTWIVDVQYEYVDVISDELTKIGSYTIGPFDFS